MSQPRLDFQELTHSAYGGAAGLEAKVTSTSTWCSSPGGRVLLQTKELLDATDI